MIASWRLWMSRSPCMRRRRPWRRSRGAARPAITLDRRERGRARDRFPPYVDPWVPAVHVIRSSCAIIAPSGMPLAIPLPARRMSGSTPKCSTAHIFPVRPIPDCTSSQTSRIPCRSQRSRRAREPAVGRHDVATLAEDRLHDDRRHLGRGDEPLHQEALDVVIVGEPLGSRAGREPDVAAVAVVGVQHARQQRTEPGSVRGLRRGQRHAPYDRPWNEP